MIDEQQFRKWLDTWWKEQHPAGGGGPPTLKEAYRAGMAAVRADAKRALAFLGTDDGWDEAVVILRRLAALREVEPRIDGKDYDAL